MSELQSITKRLDAREAQFADPELVLKSKDFDQVDAELAINQFAKAYNDEHPELSREKCVAIGLEKFAVHGAVAGGHPLAIARKQW